MADEKIGSLYVELEARTKKLENQLKSTEKKSKKAGAKSGKSFAVGFAGAMAAVLAFKKAFDFTVQAKNAARDAEETRSKFNTVFSSMSKQANLMADDFAQSFGLAGSTARELLGNTGDLLVGFGFTEEKAADLATEVNKLAVDLASFTNFSGGAAGASAALTKALLGERESVKSLGISILETDVKKQMAVDRANGLTFATERQAKAEATLRIALRQSTKAQGDYNRTKDQQANIERRLNEIEKDTIEQLGKDLLPLFNSLTKAGIGWLRILREIMGVQEVINGALARQAEFRKSLANATDEYLKKEAGQTLITLSNIQAEILKIEASRAVFEATAGKAAQYVADMFSDEDERLATLQAQEGVLQNQLDIITAILSGKPPPGAGAGAGDGLIQGLLKAKEALEKERLTLIDEKDIAFLNKEIDAITKKLERLGQIGLTTAVEAVDINEDLDSLQEEIDKETTENLTQQLGLHADYRGDLIEEEGLWANLADAQSTAMGQLAASWANQIKLFETANSMLQQFLNTLVQVGLQQVALAAIGTFAGGGILGLIGGAIGISPSVATAAVPVGTGATTQAVQALNQNIQRQAPDDGVTIINQQDITSTVIKGSRIENSLKENGVNFEL